MNRLNFYLISLINLLVILMVNSAVEIPLSKGWTITNQNQSKQLKKSNLFLMLNRNYLLRNIYILITGIKIQDEEIPSGVYSALERANITDWVLKSFNDVNLRWIAKENWKYSLNFDGMHYA